MQQTTIQFTAQQAQQRVSLQEKAREMSRSYNRWMDSKSEFYSRIAEFTVTRRAAIRIGILLPLLMVLAAITVEQAPMVAIVSAVISGTIVYQLNKSGKGGQA